MTTLYKFTGPNGAACHGGKGTWHLPKNGKPGKWMPKIDGDLVACENGYHLIDAQHLIEWIAPELWIAEARGEILAANDKYICRQARLVKRVDAWNDDNAWEFARWCALQVIHLWDAPEIVRCYLETGDESIRAAARVAASAAAWNAASAAAWAAASDAAWAAARAAAWDAARAAAWDAARVAASDAARAAASDAARVAQNNKFVEMLGLEEQPGE